MSLTRRELLVRGSRAAVVLAGAGALGGLTGCGTSRRASDIQGLAQKVSGPVLVPGDRGYEQAKLLFNPSFDDARPRAIVFCRTPQDVAAAVSFTRDHDALVAARSGGHSFGGYSAPDGGIVLNLSRMRRIEIAADRKSATVGPGAHNIDMYSTLGGAGLALPSGNCPTVGMGGLTLGGGFGFSSRKLGLTADNLLELELVLASGERVTCSSERHPDLFWAARGGGGGNFGIATSYRFRVHPVGAVSVFELAWHWSDAAAVLDAWQRWAPFAPDELFSTCVLTRAGGRSTLTSQGQFFGPLRQLAVLLEPLEATAQPVKRVVALESFKAAQVRWAGCAPDRCPRQAPNPTKVKSAFFASPIPEAGIQTAIEELDSWPGSTDSGASAGIELNAWGGAMNRVAPAATAFVHRNARLLAVSHTAWSPHDPAARVASGHDWLERLYEKMSPYASGFAYQNLIDPELLDWQHAYYGSNYPRLTRVKAKYDPHDVFRFSQGVRGHR